MTLLGWISVIAGALIVGAVAQWLMPARMPFRWVVTALAAFVGAVVTSELLFSGYTPEFEGMAVWPTIIGGLLVAIVVDVIAQYYAGRQSTGHGAAVH